MTEPARAGDPRGGTAAAGRSPASDPWAALFRLFAWGMVAVTGAYLVENWLVFWRGWPTALSLFGAPSAPAGLTAGLYLLAALAAVAVAFAHAGRGLRDDQLRITALARFLARAAFWAVLLVGIADATVSLMRNEGMLLVLFGEEVQSNAGSARWRGPHVHLPMVLLGVAIAAVTRGPGVIWLALLVVAAELTMVISRFVFSYQQAFMSDLVRFWYSALFLFASAQTLAEDAHVRVDILYASLSRRAKALVNGFGAVVFGMTLCWVILILGTASPAATINGPMLRLEIGQSSAGMFVKYLMAGFLGVFAVTMMVQFAAMLLGAVADWRGEPDPTRPDAGDVPEGDAPRPQGV